MQTFTVSSRQTRSPRGRRALLALVLAGTALTGFSNLAQADDGRVVLSTGIGAVAGALIGQSIGGRNATIVGGVLGAAIGASAATQGGNYRNGSPPAYYPPAAPVVYAPPVQVVRPAPVIYQPVYQPVYRTEYRPYVRPVVYPVYYRGGHDGRYDSDDRRGHDDHGWDRGDRDGRRGGDHRR